mmetsp:Transcript_4239/g.7187  ORF Transcript_4239/g.7187 Transcript_4239/m.7187 type:complete len:409 (+) Transcript_4239:398-1624(+)
MVKDQVYFGDDYSFGHDGFMFSFGCVSEETNLFYDQRADGILGLGMSQRIGVWEQKPIYEAMYSANVTQKRMFSMCLGKDGGFMQVGGFNEERHIEQVEWMPLTHNTGTNYKLSLYSIAFNQHQIQASSQWSVGFVDSGTTFSYFPKTLWDQLMLHFDYFCEQTTLFREDDGQRKYCHGQRFMAYSQGSLSACFKFDRERFEGRHKDFLLGYPMIRFKLANAQGRAVNFIWYPSEYLYLDPEGDKYCFAGDTHASSYEVMFGSTLMRQHHFIFDVENKQLGIARAKCSPDPNFIASFMDYLSAGKDFGIRTENLTAQEERYLDKCAHAGQHSKQTYPTPNKNYPVISNGGSNNNYYPPGKSSEDSGGSQLLQFFLRLLGLLALIFLCVFCYSLFKEALLVLKRFIEKR